MLTTDLKESNLAQRMVKTIEFVRIVKTSEF